MPVISMPSGYVVVISDRSESQYPVERGMLRAKGLVRRFPKVIAKQIAELY